MNKLDFVEQPRLRTDLPAFRPGDTVKVHVKVREGTRERVQVFQGVVISKRGGGLRESFTVRKISFGVGVERVFPMHGPAVAKVEIVQHGKVRRAKLYYLRERTGRHAKIRERRVTTPVEGAAVAVETIVPELAAPEPVAVAPPAAPAAEVVDAEQVEAPASEETATETTTTTTTEEDPAQA